MCLIACVPANLDIDETLLLNAYGNNPDGWGIMFANENKLNTIKDVSDFDTFLQEWKNTPKDAKRAVHFRQATHGTIGKDNCHPFRINASLAMMHNGVIHFQGGTKHLTKVESDSAVYSRNIKSYLKASKNNTLLEVWKQILQETSGSKILFMDVTGKTMVTYKKEWHKENGVLFSNVYSLLEPVKTYAGYSEGESGVWNDSYYLGEGQYDGQYEDPQSQEDFRRMTDRELKNWVFMNSDKAAEIIRDLLG